MKKIVFAIAAIALLASCEQSEGGKYGILQKVSHKTMPCDYYEIQVAFEGGKVTGSGDGAAYSNAQDFKIDKVGYDTLVKHQGDRVVVEYNDGGFAFCGSSKVVTTITFK